MTDAILAVRPDAIFVNSESSEFYQPCCPDRGHPAHCRFRERAPLPAARSHLCARVERPDARPSREHGREDEYRRFMAREVPRRSILGVDYYEWNEKLIDRDGRTRALGELFGWYVIANQYCQRYRRTMMHTETNRLDARTRRAGCGGSGTMSS